jgi:alcohol dehydrogenase (cytochrome c)
MARVLSVGSAALVAGLLALIAAPVGAEGPVTYERLLNPEPENWLMTFGNYQGWRFSQLDEINRDNVSGLKLAFAVPLNVSNDSTATNQGTPLVDDGFLYLTDQLHVVHKIDVSSGQMGSTVWTLDPGIPFEVLVRKAGRNRGVALAGDKVIHNTVDGRVMALDRENGDVVWEKAIRDPEVPDVIPMFDANPLAVKDMVIVGQSHGDNGIRGFVVALDPETGDEKWRFNLVPSPGEPGHETWPQDNDAWKYGGAGMWMGPTYDAESSRLLVGTSNPSPAYDPEFRPGDNLYSSSTVALNVDTGELDWYHQTIPNDGNEMDEISPRLIYDIEFDGAPRQVIGWFSKIGYYMTVDRNTGEFLGAEPAVSKLDLIAGFDIKTGKPVDYDPTVELQAYRGSTRRAASSTWCAGHRIASVFPPAFHPDLGLAYQVAADQCRSVQAKVSTIEMLVENAGRRSFTQGQTTAPQVTDETKIIGVDVRTGKIAASVDLKYQSMSGPLATKGGLVFAGHPDGRVTAHDASTLAELWSMNVGTPFKAPAISYAVDGKQYVAIIGGSNGATNQTQFPEILSIPNGSMLWVFSL